MIYSLTLPLFHFLGADLVAKLGKTYENGIKIDLVFYLRPIDYNVKRQKPERTEPYQADF